MDRFSCPICRQSFLEKTCFEAHRRESLHAYCSKCDIFSPTKRLHAIHTQSHSPFPVIQFRCCDCELDFTCEAALENHLRDIKVHGVERKSNKKEKEKQKGQEEHNQRTKCTKCKKVFKNQGSMEQHLSSVRHNPLSDIKCVADAQCKKRFKCPSAQLHHLEAGKCVSGMTKTKLNAAIAMNDIGRIITSGGVTAQRIVQGNTSSTSTSQTQSPILTPTSSEFPDSYPPSPILTPTSCLSTSKNFHPMLTLRPKTGGGSQTCPLCPSYKTRTFHPRALQQHLSSKVHAQVSTSLPLPSPVPAPNEVIFHCPRALVAKTSAGKAMRQFSSVSGLAQHLESGACDGGKETFRRVVEYVQEEMKAMGFSGMKLLS